MNIQKVFVGLCCKLYSMPHPSLPLPHSTPHFRSSAPSRMMPTPLFCPFPCRFPIQLPSTSHQIRGRLQHHVQPGRDTAAAQQRLLVQGGMHAPKHGALVTAGPAQQLCPTAGSAVPAGRADLLTVTPSNAAVSPAAPPLSFLLHSNNSFINRVLPPTAPPGVNLTCPSFTAVIT